MVIRFYVGTEKDSQGRVMSADLVESAKRAAESHLCAVYDGFTQFEVRGGYKHHNGVVVHETGLIYETFDDALTVLDQNARRTFEVAQRLKALFCQESVLVAVQEIQKAFV